MLLDSQKTEECFRKIKQIKEHQYVYCISRDSIPVSAEDLFWSVGDMYGLRIEKYAVASAAHSLNSLVERYIDGRAIVYVRADLSTGRKRFAAVKELMHLALDEREDWSVDGTKTLADLFVEMSIANGNDHPPENATQSEILAEIAAIEILYPYEFRAKDKADIAANVTTVNKLALEYQLPAFIIDKALSEWYARIADTMWARIAAQAA